MRVPAHTEGRYGDLIERLMAAAAAKERGYREYREPSEHTRLEWRVESTSSDRRRRRPETTPSDRPSSDRPQRPHFHELIRLAEQRGQPVPRVGLNRSASSDDPYRSCTSQELRLRRPLSSESSTGEEATEH